MLSILRTPRLRLRFPGPYPVLLILAVFSAASVFGQDFVAREYQVKAVFLFNFTQFVVWPPGSFPHEESPMVIGVVGEDPFGSFLDETVTGETVGRHPLTVRRFSTIEDVTDCHILFVNLAAPESQRRLLEKLRGKPVLTVSDRPGFIENGGMIRFYRAGAKIRMRINHGTAETSKLSISSKLLRLADVVPDNDR